MDASRNNPLVYAVPAIVIAALVAGFGPSDVGTAAPLTTSGADDCGYADVHNTAKIAAGLPLARIEAGSRINETGGSAWFTEIPRDEEVALVGPDGVRVEPLTPLDGEAIFHRVPLCNTGTWRLVDHDTNETITRFETAVRPDPRPPGTLGLDHPIERREEASYDAGLAGSKSGGVFCSYRGDAVVSMSAGQVESVNVSVDWTAEELDDDEEVLVTLRADGRNQTHLTTTRIPEWSNGTTSVYPDWESPSAVDVGFTGWFVQDGEFWGICRTRATLAVGPGFGSLDPSG